MFGVRFAPLLSRVIAPRVTTFSIPKFQLYQLNRQTSSILQRNFLLQTNYNLKNLLQRLQEMSQDLQLQSQGDLENVCLSNQVCLRMCIVNMTR